MPQTPNAISLKDCKVEYTTDGTTYVDITGWSTDIRQAGGKRRTVVATKYESDVPVIGIGKREPISLGVTVLYTEASGDPYLSLLTDYVSGAAVGIRWTPQGYRRGSLGIIQRYTTQLSSAVIEVMQYPQQRADGGAPVALNIGLVTPAITTSTVDATFPYWIIASGILGSARIV